MSCKFVYTLLAASAICVIGASGQRCPVDGNCVCGGSLALELQCNIEGRKVKLSLLPDTYIVITCDNPSDIKYDKLPKLSANGNSTFKSVSFKDCPLPETSFKGVLNNIGVTKTLSLIYQNARNTSGYLDRKHFVGLHGLTKLLLSVNGLSHIPDNLFMDMHNLTWLNIRSNTISLNEKLFRPLEKLETLEISHNHMTNISSSLFSHLSFLRKLSLWQNNVTRFSKDLFRGVNVLEELDFSSNGLNELPPSIFYPLVKLKKITLFANKFSSLPEHLFHKNVQLESITILNNDIKLKKLPRGFFSEMSNLLEIYVQRCELEEIPFDLFLDSPKIRNMSFAYNEIETLPEAIFNDQINLLELDLSHNKITKLEPKLFSSLVRLETLKLCHNSLERISGSTFTPLLSLSHVDISFNKIKTISSYLFPLNRQKMEINMAYNLLNFETEKLIDNSWANLMISPFAFTYETKLLNLSHNRFRVTFDDFWLNSHEKLDISHNNITMLWTVNMSLAQGYFDRRKYCNKPPKVLLFRNNPLICNCTTVDYLDMMKTHRTKGAEWDDIPHCDVKKLDCFGESFWSWRNLWMTIFNPLLVIIELGFCVYLWLKRRTVTKVLKKFVEKLMASEPKQDILLIKYNDNDIKFVMKELLPGISVRTYMKVKLQSVKNCKESGLDKNKYNIIGTFIVFSPNYLLSNFSTVNIRHIRDEIIRNDTFHIFMDVGPDNSIYTFLKEHRDRSTSVVWKEAEFWDILFEMINNVTDPDDEKSVEEQPVIIQTGHPVLRESSSNHTIDLDTLPLVKI